MPSKPFKPCSDPSCNQLTRSVYCEKHTKHKEEQRESHSYYNKYKRDKEIASFYKTKAWRQLRSRVYARDNGLCQECKREGRVKLGKIVHHMEEYKDRKDLALVESNLETLCMACHNKVHGG